MPTLTDKTDRHTIIDRRDGEYLCFPDVVMAADGRLVAAYNEAEQHVSPEKRDLLVKSSTDNGATWSEFLRVDVPRSHCPRLTRLRNDDLMMVSSSLYHHLSTDNGLTWTTGVNTNSVHDMLDRVIELEDGTLISTGHLHRGTFPQPAIRQAPAEQMVYRSEDMGENWQPMTVTARARNLVLCEASMTLLPDGRLLSIMRENSFVFEPMYVCISEDEGCTWSDPMPTPLIGHRPTIGVLDDDTLLVTYRNVAPDMGTCAWMGSLEDLLGDFKIQGRHESDSNPILTEDGLRITNDEGVQSLTRYALRPITDPRSAKAVLEADVRVDAADTNGCGLRLGVWWRISPDSITPEIEDAEPVTIEPGCFNTIRLEYEAGVVTLFVNGEMRTQITVDDDHANTRPVLFGAPYPFEENSVDATWRSVSLDIKEPHLLREYSWKWDFKDGLPDQWALDNILELKNDRYAAAPDFGYSGWTQLEDGSFYCVYHHGGGTDEGYEPMFTSYVMGTRFYREDFSD